MAGGSEETGLLLEQRLRARGPGEFRGKVVGTGGGKKQRRVLGACISKPLPSFHLLPQVHVHPEPQDATLFENSIFVDVIS